MELARERQRAEHERRDDEPPALEREQQRREQERDEAEQVPGRLADAVRHEAEDRAADERRRAREPERAQPPAREPAGEQEREEDDQVVRPHVAEGGGKRPVRRPEQPALEVRRRLGLRPERVRVGERRVCARELVPDEPERPAELEMVARGGLAVAQPRAVRGSGRRRGGSRARSPTPRRRRRAPGRGARTPSAAGWIVQTPSRCPPRGIYKATSRADERPIEGCG